MFLSYIFFIITLGIGVLGCEISDEVQKKEKNGSKSQNNISKDSITKKPKITDNNIIDIKTPNNKIKDDGSIGNVTQFENKNEIINTKNGEKIIKFLNAITSKTIHNKLEEISNLALESIKNSNENFLDNIFTIIGLLIEKIPKKSDKIGEYVSLLNFIIDCAISKRSEEKNKLQEVSDKCKKKISNTDKNYTEFYDSIITKINDFLNSNNKEAEQQKKSQDEKEELQNNIKIDEEKETITLSEDKFQKNLNLEDEKNPITKDSLSYNLEKETNIVAKNNTQKVDMPKEKEYVKYHDPKKIEIKTNKPISKSHLTEIKASNHNKINSNKSTKNKINPQNLKKEIISDEGKLKKNEFVLDQTYSINIFSENGDKIISEPVIQEIQLENTQIVPEKINNEVVEEISSQTKEYIKEEAENNAINPILESVKEEDIKEAAENNVVDPIVESSVKEEYIKEEAENNAIYPILESSVKEEYIKEEAENNAIDLILESSVKEEDIKEEAENNAIYPILESSVKEEDIKEEVENNVIDPIVESSVKEEDIKEEAENNVINPIVESSVKEEDIKEAAENNVIGLIVKSSEEEAIYYNAENSKHNKRINIANKEVIIDIESTNDTTENIKNSNPYFKGEEINIEYEEVKEKKDKTESNLENSILPEEYSMEIYEKYNDLSEMDIFIKNAQKEINEILEKKTFGKEAQEKVKTTLTFFKENKITLSEKYEAYHINILTKVLQRLPKSKPSYEIDYVITYIANLKKKYNNFPNWKPDTQNETFYDLFTKEHTIPKNYNSENSYVKIRELLE